MLREAAEPFANHYLDTHILGTGHVPGPFADALRGVGYTVHHEPFRRSMRFFWQFFKWLRWQRFDVVHIHPEQAFFFYALVCWLARVPRVVASIHNVYSYSGTLWVRRVVQTWLVERVFGVVRLAVSEAVADNERTRYGSHPPVLHNWLDTSTFAPLPNAERTARRAELGLLNSDFILVMVGKCTAIKNHTRLFEIMTHLPPNVVCLHLGTGDCEADERAFCHRHGLHKRVRFLGNQTDVYRYMQVADLHVLPSLVEGVGNVYLEASACGLLSLVNDAPGLREVVQYGRTGLLADAATEAFADTLRTVIADPAAYRPIADRARQHVLHLHQVEKNVQTLLNFYRNESTQEPVQRTEPELIVRKNAFKSPTQEVSNLEAA
jgi:glycosyltransferase involved in cell wall biosynthesis